MPRAAPTYRAATALLLPASARSSGGRLCRLQCSQAQQALALARSLSDAPNNKLCGARIPLTTVRLSLYDSYRAQHSACILRRQIGARSTLTYVLPESAPQAPVTMDNRVFFHLTDSISAATTVAELDAIRELVARATMDLPERRVLERAIRSRADAILLTNAAALERAPGPAR